MGSRVSGGHQDFRSPRGRSESYGVRGPSAGGPRGASVFLEPRGWLGGYGVWRPSTGGSGGCQGTRGSRGLSEDRKSGSRQGAKVDKLGMGFSDMGLQRL